MIDIEKTISLRGYDPLMLTHGSNKKVWAVCNKCGHSRWVIYQDYIDLCWSCSIDNPERKEKTSEKLSLFQHKRYEDPKERRKTGDSIHKAYEDDPEYRIKVGRASTLMWENNPEMRKNASAKFKRLWKDPSYRAGMFTREIRKKMSDSKIALLSTDEGRERMRQQRLKQKFNRVSSIEIKMQNILKSHGYFFKTQVPICNICIPDIVFPDRQIIIQCDGDYWHNYPEGNEQDHKQDKILAENGWRVIRFWEHEINNSIQYCLRKFESIYNDTEYVPYYTQGTLNDWW